MTKWRGWTLMYALFPRWLCWTDVVEGTASAIRQWFKPNLSNFLLVKVPRQIKVNGMPILKPIRIRCLFMHKLCHVPIFVVDHTINSYLNWNNRHIHTPYNINDTQLSVICHAIWATVNGCTVQGIQGCLVLCNQKNYGLCMLHQMLLNSYLLIFPLVVNTIEQLCLILLYLWNDYLMITSISIIARKCMYGKISLISLGDMGLLCMYICVWRPNLDWPVINCFVAIMCG